MVSLITHRVRISREGRLSLREHGIRVRPFKSALVAFVRMDQKAVEIRVRHRWVEDLGERFNGATPERFHSGLPVVIDYQLLPTMVPADVVRG